MSFAAPLWLGLLVLPLALLLLHFRRHARPRTVSSEALWREFRAATPGTARPRAVPPSRSLVLTLATLAGLTLAAADPWSVEDTPPPVVAVVLDASGSMDASAGGPQGRSRLVVASEAAGRVLRADAAAPARFLFVAGDEERFVSAAPGDDEPLRAALARVEVARGASDLAGATSRALDAVRAGGGGRVTVISDFCGAAALPAPRLDDTAVLRALVAGGSVDNVALARLVASPGRAPFEHDLAATVRNASDIAQTVTLTALLDGAVLRRESATLDADGRLDWRFDVTAAAGGTLEVRVTPGGGLAADDALRLTLPGARAVAFAGVDPLPAALEAALEAISGGPGEAEDGAGAVALFRGALPEPLPPRWIFLAPLPRATGEPAPAPAPIVLDRVPGVEAAFLDAAEPLVVPAGALPVALPPAGAEILALAAGLPALARLDLPGSRGVWWGISLEATDHARRGTLPLVLSRSLLWIAGSEGLLEAGNDADLRPRPPAGAADAELAAVGGPRRLRTWILGGVLLLALVELGRRLAAEVARGAAPAPARSDRGARIAALRVRS